MRTSQPKSNVQVQVGSCLATSNFHLEQAAAGSLIEKRGFLKAAPSWLLLRPKVRNHATLHLGGLCVTKVVSSSRSRYCFEIASWLWHEQEDSSDENSLSGFGSSSPQQQYVLFATRSSTARHSPSHPHQLMCFYTICTDSHTHLRDIDQNWGNC